MKINLQNLLDNNIIDEATAARIRNYYEQQPDEQSNRLLAIFSVIGALLVGLGVILIVAHNWDDFSQPVKVLFAFLPVLIGQAAAAYARFWQSDKEGWREGSAVFLCLAIGACLALVSQIYQIPGELSDFLFSWILLSLPIVYVMRSSMVSLLVLAGSTWYGVALSYGYKASPWHAHWLFIGALVPHFWYLIQQKPKSNFTAWHMLGFTITVFVLWASIGSNTNEEWFVLSYFSLFNILFLLPYLPFWKTQNWASKAFRILGSLGMIIMALVFSFREVVKEILFDELWKNEPLTSINLWLGIFLIIICTVLFAFFVKSKRLPVLHPETAFLYFFFIFLLSGLLPPGLTAIFFNILVLLVGIYYIRRGIDWNHLGVLNYGLLIILALTLCRFFGTDWSFVIRGILFLLVGIGFFVLNVWLIRQRKENEQDTIQH